MQVAALAILLRDVEGRVFSVVMAKQGEAEKSYKNCIQGQLLSLIEKHTFESTRVEREAKEKTGAPFLGELRNYKWPMRKDKMKPG